MCKRGIRHISAKIQPKNLKLVHNYFLADEATFDWRALPPWLRPWFKTNWAKLFYQ